MNTWASTLAQALLLKKTLEIRFIPGTPMSTTINEINDLFTKIKQMGTIDGDRFETIALINAMNGEFANVQSAIQSMAHPPDFSSDTVLRLLEAEKTLIMQRREQSPTHDPTAHAEATGKNKKVKHPCSNCKRTNHPTDFCISPGGKMAGRSIDEARAAQRAAPRRPPRGGKLESESSNSSNTSTTTTSTTTTSDVALPPLTIDTDPPIPVLNSITINGITYYPAVPTATPPAITATTAPAYYDPDDVQVQLYPCDFVETDLPLELEATPAVSVNWDDYSDRFVDLFQFVASTLPHPAGQTPITKYERCPFIFDTGATYHISPERSDFKSLRPCATHPVKGLGDSCVYAVGIGTIDLHPGPGDILSLHDVLFVPGSTTRFISVPALNLSGKYSTHFDSDGCWVLDLDGNSKIVACGTVSPTRQLYPLMATDPSADPWVTRSVPVTCTDDIEMVRKNAIQGMAIDLSSLQPKVDHCMDKQSDTVSSD
jgi:hypothetical protein